MNLREALLYQYSKVQAERIAQYVGADKERFAELMHIFLQNDYRLTQRAAWVLNKCTDIAPWLIVPYIESLLLNLHNPHIHDAVRRNTFRILQFVEIPETLHGLAVERCFAQMKQPQAAVAIRVLAMSVLANLIQHYPELQDELSMLIKDQLPYEQAAFRSRGNKILIQLSKLRKIIS